MNTTLAIWTLKWIMKLKFMKLYDEQWMKFMKVCKLAINTMTLWMKLMKLKNAWYLFNCYEELHIISDCFELFWHWWILFLTYFWGDPVCAATNLLLTYFQVVSCMVLLRIYPFTSWHLFKCPVWYKLFDRLWMILLYRVKC